MINTVLIILATALATSLLFTILRIENVKDNMKDNMLARYNLLEKEIHRLEIRIDTLELNVHLMRKELFELNADKDKEDKNGKDL